MIGANTAVELPAGATLRLTNDTKMLMTNWSALPAAVPSAKPTPLPRSWPPRT